MKFVVQFYSGEKWEDLDSFDTMEEAEEVFNISTFRSVRILQKEEQTTVIRQRKDEVLAMKEKILELVQAKQTEISEKEKQLKKRQNEFIKLIELVDFYKANKITNFNFEFNNGNCFEGLDYLFSYETLMVSIPFKPEKNLQLSFGLGLFRTQTKQPKPFDICYAETLTIKEKDVILGRLLKSFENFQRMVLEEISKELNKDF